MHQSIEEADEAVKACEEYFSGSRWTNSVHSRFDADSSSSSSSGGGGDLSDGMISQALPNFFLPDLDNFDRSKFEAFSLKYFAVAESLSDSRIRAVILDIWNDLSKRQKVAESQLQQQQQQRQQSATHSDAANPRKQLSLLKKKQEERLSSPPKAPSNTLSAARSRSRLESEAEPPKDKEIKRKRSLYSTRHAIMPRRIRTSTPTVRADQDSRVSDSSFELKANRRLQAQFVGRPLPVVREEVDSTLEEAGGESKLRDSVVGEMGLDAAPSLRHIQAPQTEMEKAKTEKDSQSTQTTSMDRTSASSGGPARDQPQPRAVETTDSEEYYAKEARDSTEDCETSSLSSGSTSSYVLTRLYNNLADIALTTSSPPQSRAGVAFPAVESPKLNSASAADPISDSKMQLLRSALQEEATRILAQGENSLLFDTLLSWPSE